LKLFVFIKKYQHSKGLTSPLDLLPCDHFNRNLLYFNFTSSLSYFSMKAFVTPFWK